MDMSLQDFPDSRYFKAFKLAADIGNFTRAAKLGGFTQSGVSQQVSKLEKQLGVQLFSRTGRQVGLTQAGRELRSFIDEYGDAVDGLVEKFHKERTEIKGQVRYAMPDSCLKTPHFGLLLKKRSRFSGISLKILLTNNQKITEKVLAEEVDFGFVTQRSDHPRLEYLVFAREQYVLVGLPKIIKNIKTAKDLKETDFIFYPGFEERFSVWRKHYYPLQTHLGPESLHVRGEINHMDGVTEMLNEEVGVTVIPLHCVSDPIKRGKLSVLSPHSKPAIGDIYIVTRRDQFIPRRVRVIMNAFLEMKGKPKKK